MTNIRSSEITKLMNNPAERKRARETLAPIEEANRPISASSAGLAERERYKRKLNDEAIQQLIASDVLAFDKISPTTSPNSVIQQTSALDQNIIAAANQHNSFSFFNKLPKDILKNYLLSYLDLEKDIHTVSALSQLSKKSRASELFKKHLFRLHLKNVLTAIVYGQKDKVETMLHACPAGLRFALLTTPLEVVDYSGRKIYGTALQLALGAEDFSQKEFPQEGIVEILMSFMRLLSNGESLIQIQMHEQFPKDWETKEEERKKADSIALHKVTTAIINASPVEDCEIALNEFREYLRPKHTIYSGKHFNIHLLMEASQLYEQLDNNNLYKKHLYWCKVIGYIQRYLPANYAQGFCQILLELSGKPFPLNRTLMYQYEDDILFFPLSPNARDLGYDYAVLGSSLRHADHSMNLSFLHRAKHLSQYRTKALMHYLTESVEKNLGYQSYPR